MTLPGCGCDCCGVSGPILPAEAVPAGMSLLEFLNGDREFVSSYSASPQRWQGSGFVATTNLFGQPGPPAAGSIQVHSVPDVIQFSTVQNGLLQEGPTSSVRLPNGLVVEQANLGQYTFNRTGLADGRELIVVREGAINEDSSTVPVDYSSELECRILVERDGVVVSDRVRPTESQLNSDTQADGEYVITRFFGSEYDEPRADNEAMPPARPTRFISVLTVDNSKAAAGLLPWNDSYAGNVDTQDRLRVYFQTKPSTSFDVFGGLSDLGDRARPAYNYTAVTQPAGVTASGASIFNLTLSSGPPAYPSLPYRVHQVPGNDPANRGPQPRFRHPGLDTREHFRTRSQAERVITVLLDFSEPVDPSTVASSQLSFLVNGESVSGATIAPVGGSNQTFAVSVPGESQVEGAFCVLTYDPDGVVLPLKSPPRPSVLAARTSWLMQKAYKRQRSLTRKDLVLSGTSRSFLVSNPQDLGTFIISLAPNVSFFSNEIGVVAERKSDDRFTPGMPNLEGQPADCSHWGLNTTIHPCPPAWLECPNAGAIQRSDSAFFVANVPSITIDFGGSLGPITLTNSGQQGEQNTYSFADTSGNFAQSVTETQFATYKRIRTQTTNKIGITMIARRRVTQYEELKTSYAWELELVWGGSQEVTTTWEHIPNDPLVPAPPSFPTSTNVIPLSGIVTLSLAEEQARQVEKRPVGFSGPSPVKITF